MVFVLRPALWLALAAFATLVKARRGYADVARKSASRPQSRLVEHQTRNLRTQAASARRIGRGSIDLRRRPLTLHVGEGPKSADYPLKATDDDFHDVVDETLGWLADHFAFQDLVAIGRRVVHGGDRFAGPILIDDETLAAIIALTPLAPLHQPQSIQLIQAIRRARPQTPQVASFDTAFHRSQSDLVRRFALPRRLFDEGVKRYGFHGLSYKYVAGQLMRLAPEIAKGRPVVAHLGSGASLCALEGGLSRDTTMGFSTLDGAPKPRARSRSSSFRPTKRRPSPTRR